MWVARCNQNGLRMGAIHIYAHCVWYSGNVPWQAEPPPKRPPSPPQSGEPGRAVWEGLRLIVELQCDQQ